MINISVLVIENDNGHEQRFMFEDISRNHEDGDGTVHLKVDGVEVQDGSSVRGSFLVKARQIQRIV